MKELLIEEAAFATEADFHIFVARELGFPSYYGANFAALADCLDDITHPTRLVFRQKVDGAEWFSKAESVARRAAGENPALDVIAYVDDISLDGQESDAHVSADEALARLKRGNRRYLEAHTAAGDVSSDLVERLFHEGQTPYAVVIACADSRVVPEHMFMCGLGEIFCIRTAGNTVGQAELASAVYACDHLGAKLLVVLGHTHCGAVGAAIEGEHHGAVAHLTRQIAEAIGDETDPYAASVLNVREGLRRLRANGELVALQKDGLRIMGAVYHTHSGVVDFLE